MTITASRLSEGNKLFPAEVHIEPNGLTIKFPGMFSGQSRHLDYQQIGEVSIDSPLVGFSSITFFTAGTRVSANGFTSAEVKQIKNAIDSGRNGGKVSNDNNDSNNSEVDLLEAQLDHDKEMLEAQLDHDKEMLEEKQKHELRVESIRASSEAIDKINGLDLGGENPTPESISKQLEFCLTLASSHLSESFDEIKKNEKEREKYNQSEKVVNAAIKKAELGVNKLRLCEPKEKALNFFTVYYEQVKQVRIKQLQRKWEIKIAEAKPSMVVAIVCVCLFPLQVYAIYKAIEIFVLLPKKRDLEISLVS